MANPVSIALAADVWTVVATNVTAGYVWAQDAGTYVQTFKLTGQAAPTDDDEAAAGPVHNGPAQEIKSAVAIDVYIKRRRTAGRVRVDL